MTPPQIEACGAWQIVRDDLLPGGTKQRVLHVLFEDGIETYCYASPSYGFAQVALAVSAKEHGKQAVVFCPQRRARHERTRMAESFGARIVEVPHGRMSVLRARAYAYCASVGARLLPFGLDDERVVGALANVARSMGVSPYEVWCVAGSGMLARALQLAWPLAQVHAVRIGADPTLVEGIRLWTAPERFEQEAEHPPPFPSCSHYDAKAWRFFRQHASPGALFWNVAR